MSRKKNSIVLIFTIKKTPPHVISEILSNCLEQLKQEPLRTAASEIIWGNSRDGFLFYRCNRPEILEQLFRKIRENFQAKICVGVLFLILATKTRYYGQFPSNFKCYKTATSRNSFGRLLLESFFSQKQSPESVRKAALKNFRNF